MLCGLNANSIRLLIVDDSALLREGIAAVLSRVSEERKIEVVGSVGSIAEAMTAVVQEKPDVVLLDLRLPDGSGIDACRALLAKQSKLGIIILSSYLEDAYIHATIAAGARGYLLKDVQPAALIEAIRRVAKGESTVSPEVTSRVLALLMTPAKDQEPDRFTTLSPQEKKVLELVVLGRTNKQIAGTLELSENTVKNYLATVFEKLQVKRRTEAAALFLKRQRPR